MLSPVFLCAVLALGQTADEPIEMSAQLPFELPSPNLVEQAATPLPADRWALAKFLQGSWPGHLFENNRMAVYGWTEMSFTASSATDSNLPLGFNYKANDFLLQQNWLRIERSVLTTGTSAPTFGFRLDTILPGSDYVFTTARGLFSGQLTADNGRPNLYGIDPIQFYGEGYFPTLAQGMDVKLGRFFAQYGVESNDAVSNALCSHAYTFIYDPFTNTGLLTTTKLSASWSVQAGLVLGSDDFIDPVDTATFIGSVKWVRPDQRDSLVFSVIVGSDRFNQSRHFNNPDVFDLVFTHTINQRFHYLQESLLGVESAVPDIGTAEWFGILNYLTYDWTPRLSSTVRLEFFDDIQGERTGFEGLYSALTAGMTIRPRKDLIFRPELRYDYNDDTRPFEGKHGLFTATADVILRW